MQCPFDGKDISPDRLDCGAHRRTSMSASPDPLYRALQLAEEQLQQRISSFEDAAARVTSLASGLQAALASIASLETQISSARENVAKLQQLIGTGR